MDFAVPTDFRVKLMESEKRDKYQARELKKTMEHEIVIGALGKVSKGLAQGLENLEIRRQVETI